MPSENIIIFTGHAGRDAETFADGKITRLNIASSERYKQGDEWKSKTTWMTVKLFGNNAKFSASVKKGDTITVRGSIKNEEWEDKQGNKRTSTYIEVSPYDKFVNFSELSRREPQPAEIRDDLPF